MGSRDANRRHSAETIGDALGVRLFKRPPEGFDPIAAADRELLVHGYPDRPNAERHPELYEHWKHVVWQSRSMIDPQFAVAPGIHHRPVLPVAPTSGNGWSGSAAFAGLGDPVTFVSGSWTVPAIVAPGAGDCACATWVGIDGAPGGLVANESTDILQAGTTQAIIDGSHVTYAWYEWLPEQPYTISNFPVSPGDVVFCLICANSPTEAKIYMTNITTTAFTSFIKTVPGSWQLVGNCAEWILEAPTANGVLSTLPRYGEVYFDKCIAGTQNHALLYAGAGNLQTMYDINGHAISTPQIETDELIKIQYTA